MLKLILLLIILISVEAYNKPFQRKLYKNTHNLNDKEPSGLSKLFQRSFESTTLYDLISVGTPENYFWISVETGFNQLWLVHPDYPGYDPEQNKCYSPDNSTTAKGTGDVWYGKTGRVRMNGPVYEDVLEYQTTNKQRFARLWSASSGSEQNLVFPFDGILGLSWDPKENKRASTTASPIINILDGQEKRIFTVWQDGSKDGLGSSNSILTFGAFDTVNCKPQISYFPIIFSNPDESLLSIRIDSFTMGSYKTKFSLLAKFDTGLSTIYLPERYHDVVQKQLNTKFDSTLEVNIAPCASVKTFPDWTFAFSNQAFTIPASEYVLDIGLPNGLCAVAFDINYYTKIDFAFGNPLLRKYCSVYDVDNGKIGLAEAIHHPYRESSTPDPF